MLSCSELALSHLPTNHLQCTPESVYCSHTVCIFVLLCLCPLQMRRTHKHRLPLMCLDMKLPPAHAGTIQLHSHAFHCSLLRSSLLCKHSALHLSLVSYCHCVSFASASNLILCMQCQMSPYPLPSLHAPVFFHESATLSGAHLFCC